MTVASQMDCLNKSEHKQHRLKMRREEKFEMGGGVIEGETEGEVKSDI